MEKFESVLLIDDDPVSQYISQSIVKKLNIAEQIYFAMNGLEGIDFLKRAQLGNYFPDLILLDLKMPVLDGFDFLKLFNNVYSDRKNEVQIIILTTSSDKGDITKAFTYSISEFVNKPLTEKKLKAALNKTE